MVKEAPGEGYVDVSGCQGIWKKVLEEGDPTQGKPREGSFTEVEYWYRHRDSPFDSTDQDGSIEIIPGSGMSTAGMEEGVVTMNVGERASFILDPIFAFKENGYPPNVPEWAVVELEIKVLEFIGPFTEEGKIDAGKEFKAKGNAFFKDAEYKAAIKKYTRGLDVLGRRRRKLHPDMKELEDGQHLVRIQILQNIMQCYFKMGNTERCLDYVENILRQDEHNVKARFRRARHELSQHNYHTAKAHLQDIIENSTDEQVLKDVAAEFKKIEDVRRKTANAEKATARKATRAFGKLPSDPDTADTKSVTSEADLDAVPTPTPQAAVEV